MFSQVAARIRAIDVHGHYGRFQLNPSDGHPLFGNFYSADHKEVARRGRESNTQYTAVMPLLATTPRGHNDAVAGNIEAARLVPKTPGLLQWVVIDLQKLRTYDQARDLLQSPHCVGVKLHPEEHVYSIRTHGRKLFEFLAKHQCVVLTHTSERNSLCADFVPLVNDYPAVKLILAHLGHSPSGDPTHQVRAIQQSKHGNLWTDTSSANSLTPGLIEWAVQEVGAERVLYGSDTPTYCASMQRARIDHAEMPDKHKRMVLRDNAYALLRMKQREACLPR